MYKVELEEAYQAWAGKEAKEFEAAANVISPVYYVTVNRFVGRALKQSEYFFNTAEVARQCFQYWKMRGGTTTLLLCKIEDEWGVNEEPTIYM